VLASNSMPIVTDFPFFIN